MKCDQVIKNLLALLNEPSESLSLGVEKEEYVVTELLKLYSNCSIYIKNEVRFIFRGLEDKEQDYDVDQEFSLLLLLEVLVLKKDKEVAFLLERALLAESIRDKENMLELFLESNSLNKKDVIQQFLLETTSFDEMGGTARANAIEFLIERSYIPATNIIADCLSDIAVKVRSMALRYFSQLGVNPYAINKIEKLISKEADMDVLRSAFLVLEKHKVSKLADIIRDIKGEPWMKSSPKFKSFLNEMLTRIK